MPQSGPISGEGEENHISDAIPKEDNEKGPTPNPWLTKLSLATQTAIMVSTAMGGRHGSTRGFTQCSGQGLTVLTRHGSEFLHLSGSGSDSSWGAMTRILSGRISTRHRSETVL